MLEFHYDNTHSFLTSKEISLRVSLDEGADGGADTSSDSEENTVEVEDIGDLDFNDGFEDTSEENPGTNLSTTVAGNGQTIFGFDAWNKMLGGGTPSEPTF